MTEQQKLADFIMGLTKDPQRLKALKANPDRVMTEAGLSKQQIEALKSLDPMRIRDALISPDMKDAGPGNVQITLVAVIKF
jgi:hypothetical protein